MEKVNMEILPQEEQHIIELFELTEMFMTPSDLLQGLEALNEDVERLYDNGVMTDETFDQMKLFIKIKKEFYQDK